MPDGAGLAHRLHEGRVRDRRQIIGAAHEMVGGTGTPRLASIACVWNLSIMSFMVWLFDPM